MLCVSGTHSHTVLIVRLAFPEQIIDKYLKQVVVQAHAFDVSAAALFDMLQGRILLDGLY